MQQILVMRDDHCCLCAACLPRRIMRGADQLVNLPRVLRIKPRRRLVIKNDPRTHRNRPRHGDALGHAAGKFSAAFVHDRVIALEPDRIQRFASPLKNLD